MLLTRSPLSPLPKEWFSLDLHVLSAPPAFVLSQDQTLREELFAMGLQARRKLVLEELVAQSHYPEGCDGLSLDIPRDDEVST